MARIVKVNADGDHRMVGEGGAWVEWKNLSIWLRPAGNGIMLEVYRKGAEMGSPLMGGQVDNPKTPSRTGM